ncbi:MAG TPA: PA2169 family four-helix-bundle protein [Bryobacteraceae bacterium]|nr:PA2169 family four-helix-bundle protein [Bryobacteraceae bacterium]
MSTRNRPQKRVNDLISTCMDSNEGFLKAAKGIHDDELRETLTRIANRRAEMADELRRSAEGLGGQPAQRGHGGGVLRGGWVDLEQRIRPKDDATFVAECRRGENGTLTHYRDALDSGVLPEDARGIAARHLAEIEQTLEELRLIEERAKTGTQALRA